MSQWGRLREEQLLESLMYMKKTLKINLEDGTIEFEQSNQSTQKCKRSRPDRERLEDQLEISNIIAQMEKKFLNRSRKIGQSTRISQSAPSREGEVLKELSNRSRGKRQST